MFKAIDEQITYISSLEVLDERAVEWRPLSYGCMSVAIDANIDMIETKPLRGSSDIETPEHILQFDDMKQIQKTITNIHIQRVRIQYPNSVIANCTF